MKVITITNRKGGSGKTTTARAVASSLRADGFKVLAVDLDSQGNLSRTYGASCEASKSVYMALVFDQEASDLIQHTAQGDILASCEELAAIDITLTRTGKEYALKEALASVLDSYDYIIIDTPAQLGTVTVNALTASDGYIIPAEADIFSMEGIKKIESFASSVKKYTNKNLSFMGVLITRYKGRAILSKDMRTNIENLAKSLGSKAYKTSIRETIALAESNTLARSIFEYAPKSHGAEDYANFMEELKGEING